MTFLEKLQKLALPLESSEFYRNTAIFLGAITLIASGIMYYHHSKTNALRSTLQKTYKLQQEAKEILERLKNVEKQSEEVNSLLEEDKNFRLKNYFDDTVSQLGLARYQKKDAEVNEDVLQKLYTEIKLTTQFQGISTKQLCELLKAIEQKSRIYTKEISIVKKNNSLDVSLTIATLKSHVSKKG